MKRKLISLGLAAVLVCSAAVQTLAAGADAPPFTDIEGHWAQASIEKAFEGQWLTGYPDGTFRPEGTITRAEFVKMILDANQLLPAYWSWVSDVAVTIHHHSSPSPHDTLTPYVSHSFLDMDSHWLTDQGWMETALRFGMVIPSDYYGNRFGPSEPITRTEIAVMVDRAMGKVCPANEPLTEDLPFADEEQIYDWAQGYVNEAVEAGVLTGYPDGTFRHTQTATRAEAVVMIQRMLDYNLEGVDPDLNLIVRYIPSAYTSEDEVAQINTKKVRMQIVDEVIYASLYDICHVQEQMMHSHGMKLSWVPEWQQMLVYMEETSQYRAGTPYFTEKVCGSCYYPVEASDDTFRAPTRMLDGHIMIPIYEFNGDQTYQYPWDGHWDEATQTLTLDVTTPSFYFGPA